MSFHSGASVLKYGPPVVVLSFPQAIAPHFDPVMALALLIGLIAGVVWRAGDKHAKGTTWADIRSDLTVSALIGLANFIIAAIVVDIAGVPPLYAIGIAMLIAAKGPDGMQWFAERYMPNRNGDDDRKK